MPTYHTVITINDLQALSKNRANRVGIHYAIARTMPTLPTLPTLTRCQLFDYGIDSAIARTVPSVCHHTCVILLTPCKNHANSSNSVSDYDNGDDDVIVVVNDNDYHSTVVY